LATSWKICNSYHCWSLSVIANDITWLVTLSVLHMFSQNPTCNKFRLNNKSPEQHLTM